MSLAEQHQRSPIRVRPSDEEDVPDMVAIYTYHITRGFDGTYVDPTALEEIRKRRKTMLKRRLPHLVADLEGKVVGYAFAVPFRKRPAYRYTVKHSIYVHHEFMHMGIGRMMIDALIDACAAAGYRQMIGYIDGANTASLQLHESAGFHQVARLPSVGFKYGKWTDSVMMQRAIGAGDQAPPDDPPGRMIGRAPEES